MRVRSALLSSFAALIGTAATLAGLYEFFSAVKFEIISSNDIAIHEDYCGAHVGSDTPSEGVFVAIEDLTTPIAVTRLANRIGEVVYLHEFEFPWEGLAPAKWSEHRILTVMPTQHEGKKGLQLISQSASETYCLASAMSSPEPTALSASSSAGASDIVYVPREELWASALAIYRITLPSLSTMSVEVNNCEGHCRMLEGPIRIIKTSESEGITEIALVPVDIEKNAYLTMAYECTRKIVNSGPWYGRLRCIFD